MISDFANLENQNFNGYPLLRAGMPFDDYLYQCRALVSQRRADLHTDNPLYHTILNANCPYELKPSPTLATQTGALLIHGLLDCPFSLRDIGTRLQETGVLCRAVLLPGHGTSPTDLLTVSYHDWIHTVRYAIETLKQDVQKIYLIGYSTGATLAIYHALQDPDISGIVTLSPAIRIKAPVDIVANWNRMLHWMQGTIPWVYRDHEIDYAKYRSIPYNPVAQVSRLSQEIRGLKQERNLSQPVLLIMSREDETVSSHQAIDYFLHWVKHPGSEMMLYSSIEHAYPDKRIYTKQGRYPDQHILHLSHMSIPFAPNNHHYGRGGDYQRATNPHRPNAVFGAYNKLEVRFYEKLHRLKLLKQSREELTYNPDFNNMAQKICDFVS